MTVVGFPTAAATAPQTLLHQHRVTTRKIAGFRKRSDICFETFTGSY